MSDNTTQDPCFFPPGVVDQNGRRIRPGSMVRFADNNNFVTAEVVSWVADGVSLFSDANNQDDGEWYVRHPSEIERIDIEATNSLTAGEFIVESDGPTTVIIQCIGTRDLVMVPTSGISEYGLQPIENYSSFREWSENTLQIIEAMSQDLQQDVLRTAFQVPIIERVLQEAVLPRVIEQLVLITTDQENQHPQDTIFCARIIELWLQAHGHVVGRGEPNMSRRWIHNVTVWSISHLPHVVDAVTHRMKSEIETWTNNCERIVVVHGGGTPAMNTSVLIAAAHFTDKVVRHVQVPDVHRGTGEMQPLIEFDLSDLPVLGQAIKRD